MLMHDLRAELLATLSAHLCVHGLLERAPPMRVCTWASPHVYGMRIACCARRHDLHSRREIGAGPDERMHGGLAPFQTLVLPLPMATQLAITHNRARKDVALAAATRLNPPLRPSAALAAAAPAAASTRPQRARSSALRLGLFSSDFGDHPVGHALLPWVQALSRRGRRRLHVVCIASDAEAKHHAGSPLRRSIAAACGSFHDVTKLSDAEATARRSNMHPMHVCTCTCCASSHVYGVMSMACLWHARRRRA